MKRAQQDLQLVNRNMDIVPTSHQLSLKQFVNCIVFKQMTNWKQTSNKIDIVNEGLSSYVEQQWQAENDVHILKNRISRLILNTYKYTRVEEYKKKHYITGAVEWFFERKVFFPSHLQAATIKQVSKVYREIEGYIVIV